MQGWPLDAGLQVRLLLVIVIVIMNKHITNTCETIKKKVFLLFL
jgi:hypothetical protein